VDTGLATDEESVMNLGARQRVGRHLHTSTMGETSSFFSIISMLMNEWHVRVSALIHANL